MRVKPILVSWSWSLNFWSALETSLCVGGSDDLIGAAALGFALAVPWLDMDPYCQQLAYYCRIFPVSIVTALTSLSSKPQLRHSTSSLARDWLHVLNTTHFIQTFNIIRMKELTYLLKPRFMFNIPFRFLPKLGETKSWI